MKKLAFLLLTVLFFVFMGCSSSKDLDRNSAKEILIEREWGNIIFEVDAVSRSDDGNLLIEKGFAEERKGFVDRRVKPLPNLMPYLIKIEDQGLQRTVPMLLLYGKVNNVETTGISVIDESNKKVEFNLEVKPNEIGLLFEGINTIPIVTHFQLYDDGWRVKEVLWKETSAKTDWNTNRLHGFIDDKSCGNNILWNMHEMQLYSDDYMSIVSLLETSENAAILDTVALAYKDNGNKNKAIEIYQEKIIPALKKSGDTVELQNFQKKLQQIMH